MTESILIKNARMIDPSSDTDGLADILIENEIITGIGDNISEDGAEVIDAAGLCLAAGLVDAHVHLREPGFEYKEDISTGCRAAAAGGFTAIAAMPNTNPVADSVEVINYIKDKAKDCCCDVYPISAVTKGSKGYELTDFERLSKLGVTAFSDDGSPIESAYVMANALKIAKQNNAVIISHCEDLSLAGSGIINEGRISGMLGVAGIPNAAEDVMVARDIVLSEYYDSPLHLAHISTTTAVSLIKDAKKRGVKVTAETCPHYLFFTEEELLRKDANFRMNPPLRTARDVQAVIEGLVDRTIDIIATDHAPHSEREKNDFSNAPNGVVGLETAFGAVMTRLYHTGLLSLKEIINIMSTLPADILKIDAGRVAIGKKANLILFDPDQEWVVDKTKFKSKSRNTPFEGMRLKGKIKKTIYKGRVVYSD